MNKPLTRILFAVTLLSTTSFCFGQSDPININEHGIKWLYTSTLNQTNNETLDISGYFITNAGSIEWVQEYGSNSESDEMTVSSVKGSWLDVNKTGEIEFKVSLYGNAGMVTIKRASGNQVTINIEFIGEGFEEMRYQYEITNFELIN